MKIPLVDLRAQYLSIKPEIDRAIKRVINNSSFINGEENELFEKEFAQYCGVKYAKGVASGSAALDLALEALEVKIGDEVLCPSHTFAATAEAIVHRGAKPVFVDIDESTYNIDPTLVEKSITRKTRAIIVVHLYGQPADIDKIKKIARKNNLFLIEDAAQAHGAEYKNKKVGSFGDIACFSFFPAKNLGCYGDGGMIVTNSKELSEKVSRLRDHGRIGKYEHVEVGYGERLDNLQAAILKIKLKKLDDWNNRRREIAKIYTSSLSFKYTTPKVVRDTSPVYYVYTLRHPQRDKIREGLKKRGVSTGIYYPVPLHLQEAFKNLGYKGGDLPITEKVCSEIFSIPIYPELESKEIRKIIESLDEVAKS